MVLHQFSHDGPTRMVSLESKSHWCTSTICNKLWLSLRRISNYCIQMFLFIYLHSSRHLRENGQFDWFLFGETRRKVCFTAFHYWDKIYTSQSGSDETVTDSGSLLMHDYTCFVLFCFHKRITDYLSSILSPLLLLHFDKSSLTCKTSCSTN